MTDTPLFDQTAAEHREHLLKVLATPPPTSADIIAAVDAAAEGTTTEGDTHG